MVRFADHCKNEWSTLYYALLQSTPKAFWFPSLIMPHGLRDERPTPKAFRLKPRVAATRLPWENSPSSQTTPTGFWPTLTP